MNERQRQFHVRRGSMHPSQTGRAMKLYERLIDPKQAERVHRLMAELVPGLVADTIKMRGQATSGGNTRHNNTLSKGT